MRLLRTLGTIALSLGVGVLTAAVSWAQTTVTFSSTSPVDLGTQLPKLADLDPWSYTLGTAWDEPFTVGGIIGAPNTTIIPEVKVLDVIVVPEKRADTRTGARMKGRIFGDLGLEFSADFMPSGLEPGVGFHFAPTLSYPTTPEAGSFTKLNTTTGLQDNPAFNEAALDLPAVTAQIDFFFNLGLKSTIDYGLFPVVPYDSAPFINTSIHVEQRNDPNKSLVRFDASLDPDANNGQPLPPTLTFLDGVELFGTPLETRVGLLDDDQFLANKQISFEIKDKQNPTGPKRRIDVGEVQVVNPFGTGGDLLGGNTDRNLQVGTTVSDDALGYTAETPLFRLGLDLDGLAAGLATGESFTRVEEELKNKNDDLLASVTADLIDLKYGPEIGFREHVEIHPDFNVTVSFRDPANDTPVLVALDDQGSVALSSSFVGRWGDLPEIALLTTDAVDVQVQFDELTGEQNKRGAFYLSDYLEFTLLELESLNILDLLDVSVPPLFRARTSLLGNLLGELELEAYTDSAAIPPFALGGALPTQSFKITPAPSVLAYLTIPGGNYAPENHGFLRTLDGHAVVTNLAAVTVVIGQGDSTAQQVGDLVPVTVTDDGSTIEADLLLAQAGYEPFAVNNTQYDDPPQVTKTWGLQIPAGSNYEQFGNRIWELPTIVNDGYYRGAGQMTTFQNPDGTLFISGDGQIEIEQHARLKAAVIIHGAGHTLTLDTATGYAFVQGPNEEILYDTGNSSGVQTALVRLPDQVVDAPRFVDAANIFINAGTLALNGSGGEIYAGMEFDNTDSGLLALRGEDGGAAESLGVTTPIFTNNGLVLIDGGSRLDSGNPIVNQAQELRGDGLIRVSGGSVRFLDNVVAYAPDGVAIPDAASQTFEVINGGLLEFQGFARFYAKPTFTVGAGSTLTFNGLNLDGTLSGTSMFAPGAPIDVVNDGTIVFNTGDNSFKLSINEILFPGEEPTVIPIGLDNRGVVEVRNTARLTLDAEIRDYAEGGATFDAGIWRIVGPTPTGLFSNLGFDDSNVARLNLNVSRVEVGDNYLTVIAPGQPGGDFGGFSETYDPTVYDTLMAVNRSDITLSGRALFRYLDTVQRNEGTLTFDNRNHFTTAGTLANPGTIHVTNGARLTVNGDLLVDGGSVFVDAASGVDVGTNTIEVVGGSFTLDRPVGSANVNTPWIVRERTVIDDQGNVVEIIPGIVDYGGTVFPTIGPDADITLAGANAEFRPLRGLQLLSGKLTLDGGNVLTLDQTLVTDGTSELNVLGGANLIVNSDFTHGGELTIDANSYVFVGATFATNDRSVVHIDGVLEADHLSINTNSALMGSGRISGGITSSGELSPGNSAGTLQIFGAYTQDSLGRLTVDLLGPNPGDDYDQLLAASATLAGTLTIVAGPDVASTAYGKRLDFLVTDNGVTGTFDTVAGLEIDADHRWVLLYEADHVSLAAALKGDTNFSGAVDFADFLTLSSNFDQLGDWFAGDFDNDGRVQFTDFLILADHFGQRVAVATAVPEPQISWGVLLMVLAVARRERKGRHGRQHLSHGPLRSS